MDPRGPSGDPAHRQAPNPSNQSRHRVRGGDGRHVRPQPGSRRLSHHRWRGDVGTRLVQGRDHRRRGSVDRSHEPQRGHRGPEPPRDVHVGRGERRPHHRPLQDDGWRGYLDRYHPQPRHAGRADREDRYVHLTGSLRPRVCPHRGRRRPGRDLSFRRRRGQLADDASRPQQDGDPQFLQPHHRRPPGPRRRLHPAPTAVCSSPRTGAGRSSLNPRKTGTITRCGSIRTTRVE